MVGNPSIADVSVQSGKLLVVTGKSFGETNLIVMDADGKVFVNRRLIVQEPRTGFVTVYRGRRPADPALLAVLHAAARHRRRPGRTSETISRQITTKQSISQSAAEGEKQ